jgi:cytochrome b
MPPENLVAVRVWDLPVRLFHWAVVLLLAFQVVSGYVGGAMMAWHAYSGYAMLALVIFRILWGFVGGTHARFASFLAGPAATLRFARRLFSRQAVPQVGHNPLGGWNVVLLILALAIQVGSGLFANDGAGNEGPLAARVSLDLSNNLSHLHRWNVKVLLVLSGLHVAAVLFHWLFKKEDLIRAIFTGVKRVPEAAVRERRDALRHSPRRRAASREHRLAYFASAKRAWTVFAVAVIVVVAIVRWPP